MLAAVSAAKMVNLFMDCLPFKSLGNAALQSSREQIIIAIEDVHGISM
jgi:hypothetical protein